MWYYWYNYPSRRCSLFIPRVGVAYTRDTWVVMLVSELCGHFDRLVYGMDIVQLFSFKSAVQVGPGAYYASVFVWSFERLLNSSVSGKNTLSLLVQWVKLLNLPMCRFWCKHSEVIVTPQYISQNVCYGQVSVDCQNGRFHTSVSWSLVWA